MSSSTQKQSAADLSYLPNGWRAFASEMIARAEREFPGIVFTEIRANPGGWLSVNFDKHSVPTVAANWRALKLAEGYSSMSFHVCVGCGSHRANPHPGHVFPVCGDCRGPLPCSPSA